MRKVKSMLGVVMIVSVLMVAAMVTASAQFSGDLLIATGSDTLAGTIKVSGDYYRLDVTQEGMKLFIIVDQKNKMTRVYSVDDKQYREMGSQDMVSLMNDPFQGIIYTRTIADEKSLGTEKVNGFDCEKYQYSKDGQDMMLVWKAVELNFPIKIDNLMKAGHTVDITNIKKGEVDKIMFETPADYKLFEEDKPASGETVDIDIVDAAGAGNIEVLKKHIANGVDLNFDSGDGNTPLLMAAMYGRAEAVKYLIEAGANVNLVTGTGNSAMMVATQYGKLDIVKMLVAGGADLNMTYGNEYTTALREAVQYGHVDVAKYLIEAGADITFKNSLGKGLMDAANKNDAKMMEILKAAGVE